MSETPLRALVADDEPLAREFLSERLRARHGVELVAVCRDGREARRAIVEGAPDVAFLDVRMPELDGFEVLAELPAERLPAVVFVTAYDAYAVRAFETNALDYLLKPFDDARLDATLARAREHLRARTPDDDRARLLEAVAALANRAHLRRLPVQDGDRIFLQPTGDVEWIEADGKHVRLHVGGRVLRVRQSIGGLEERLDPERFLRVSRSAIVNLDAIREIQRWFQGGWVLLLASGERVTTTRTYRRNLDRLLKSRE